MSVKTHRGRLGMRLAIDHNENFKLSVIIPLSESPTRVTSSSNRVPVVPIAQHYSGNLITGLRGARSLYFRWFCLFSIINISFKFKLAEQQSFVGKITVTYQPGMISGIRNDTFIQNEINLKKVGLMFFKFTQLQWALQSSQILPIHRSCQLSFVSFEFYSFKLSLWC